MLFTAEHEEPRRSLQKFIAAEINPRVDEWGGGRSSFRRVELFKAGATWLSRIEQAGRVRRRRDSTTRTP